MFDFLSLKRPWRWLPIFLLSLSLLILFWVEKSKILSFQNPFPKNHTQKLSLICLSPSLTEILFAIGSGPQIIGVSSFASYPPQVKNLPQLGGIFHPNLEKILALHPNRVIVQGKMPALLRLSRISNIQVHVSPYANQIHDIFENILDMGKLSGHEQEAQALIRTLKTKIYNAPKLKKSPKVLIVIGHDPQQLQHLSVASHQSFLGEIVELLGAQNLVHDSKFWPTLSLEEIPALNPDVILDLSPNLSPLQIAQTKNLWLQAFPQINACQKHQVYVLTQDFLVIPGPRIVKILDVFEKYLSTAD